MNKILFKVGETIEAIKGYQKGNIGIVRKVTPIPGMETKYTVEFGTVPYELMLYESSLQEAYLFEMANIHPNDTGLKTSLHAMYNGKAEGLPRSPRVNVSTMQHGRLPIQLTPEVKLAVEKKLKQEDIEIVAAAMSYISSNIKLFLDHWNGEITDHELLDKLPRTK